MVEMKSSVEKPIMTPSSTSDPSSVSLLIVRLVFFLPRGQARCVCHNSCSYKQYKVLQEEERGKAFFGSEWIKNLS